MNFSVFYLFFLSGIDYSKNKKNPFWITRWTNTFNAALNNLTLINPNTPPVNKYWLYVQAQGYLPLVENGNGEFSAIDI